MKTFVLLAALLAIMALAERADAAFAIAFNASTGKAAAYNGSFDVEVAKKQALSACGSGCRIVASGKKNCVAVVESISTGTSAWAVAYGSTTSVAASNGWHECRRKGGVNCKTAAAICD
jgi:hypothetical protein